VVECGRSWEFLTEIAGGPTARGTLNSWGGGGRVGINQEQKGSAGRKQGRGGDARMLNCRNDLIHVSTTGDRGWGEGLGDDRGRCGL